LAVRMLGSIADAEDVTRTVLLRILRRRGPPRRGPARMTWVYRITVRAVRALRVERKNEGVPRSPAPGPGAISVGAGLSARLEAAIARLPVGYRDLFVLAEVERIPVAEAGRFLGLKPARVGIRLHLARLLLRDALRPCL
jgi:RNA polymerase sigma-70 factor, ECF subfamily